MASSRSLLLVRLTELLQTIESSSKVLREFLEEDGESSLTKDGERDPAAELAQSLGLPFQASLRAVEQASILRAACDRLGRLVTQPRHLIYELAGSHITTLALKIAWKYDIAAQILKMSKANSREGVPVEELALQFELSTEELGRLLRYLSVRGVFQEIEPGVFANTNASMAMVDNPDFAVFIKANMEEVVNGGTHYEEFMKRRRRDHDQPTPAPFTLHYGTPWYSWLHSEENAEYGQFMDLAMRDMAKTEGTAFIPFDYPFGSIAPDTLVVDVGGGVGTLAEVILPHVLHVRYVVQDLESVVTCAQEIASPTIKAWMDEGRLKFQAQDFFMRQPDNHQGAVFIVKNVLLNWSDVKAVDLLRTLRESNPSKLLVIDRIIRPHLCTEAQTEDGEMEIYRSWHSTRPDDKSTITSQILPTQIDLSMSILFGGKHRLLGEWKALFSRAGYKLVAIYPLRGSTGQAVMELMSVYD